jgi:hypothetical protein
VIPRSRHVHDDLPITPAAEWSALRSVLHESQLAQLLRQRGVLRVRGDIDYGVDIFGRSDATGGWIGDEDASRASADKDEFIEEGRKETDDGFEQLAIRISHVAVS